MSLTDFLRPLFLFNVVRGYMSEISSVLAKLNDTREAEILTQMEESYQIVNVKQAEWYEKSRFFCSEGCGECCRNFEPDLLESEAIYMAAWLIENQPEVAAALAEGDFPLPREKGCQFWDEKKTYHCTIYGGRPFICRFFGACGSRSKTGELVFKPCKFYPESKLAAYKVPLAHKQYSQAETLEIFSTLPPVMSDLMESAVSINPENKSTKLIRDILPETIRRLQWIISLNNSDI